MKKFKISWKWLIGSIIALIVAYNVIFTTESVPQYKTQTIQRGALQQSVDITSSWYPTGYSKVTLGAFQDVRKINVSEGQKVNAGQQIAQLNDDVEQNQLNSARSSLNAASKAKKNAPPGTPQSTLDSMQGQINAAYYQMKGAEVAVNKKKIKAPITGKVITVYNSNFDANSALGAATSTTNYVIIVNDKTPTFIANLSEREVDQIKVNDKVTLTSRLRLEGYTGKVTRIISAPTVAVGSDPSYPVEITLTAYPSIPFGAKIEGSIIVKDNQNATYLPYDAVTVEGVGKGSVLVLNGDTTTKKEVMTGLTTDANIEITGGLGESDAVVIDILPAKNQTILRPWITNIFKK